jgi:hypothetical protein
VILANEGLQIISMTSVLGKNRSIMNGFLIILLLLLKIQSIFMVPHEKGPILPAKGVLSWERRSRVPLYFASPAHTHHSLVLRIFNPLGWLMVDLYNYH